MSKFIKIFLTIILSITMLFVLGCENSCTGCKNDNGTQTEQEDNSDGGGENNDNGGGENNDNNNNNNNDNTPGTGSNLGDTGAGVPDGDSGNALP